MFNNLSAWVGSSLLGIITLYLFWRLGFSQGERRAQTWLALTVLYLMWSVELALLGRETSVTSFFTALIFFWIYVHRARLDLPNSRAAKFYKRHPDFFKIEDRG